MRGANIGVETKNVLVAGVDLPATKYKQISQKKEFYGRLLDQLARTPGVAAAAFTSELPLEGGSNGYITVPGDSNPADANLLVEWGYISPDYFRAMGIPFLQGRSFTPEEIARGSEVSQKLLSIYESAKNPEKVSVPPDLSFVAVINQTMAKTFWPGQDPIGKTFRNGDTGPQDTVIGVVGDVKEWGITDKTIPQAYFPATVLFGWGGSHGTLVVKTTVAPSSLIGAVRTEVRNLDSSLAVFSPRTMDDVVADNMQDASLRTYLLGVFAVLTLILAAVGIYGVMAYLVTQRTHEIGIRMALGARRQEVLALVLKHGIRLTLVGVAIGALIAVGLTRVIAGLLYGVTASDPLTFVAVSVLLILVSVVAWLVPASRAARVDPMIALRYE